MDNLEEQKLFSKDNTERKSSTLVLNDIGKDVTMHSFVASLPEGKNIILVKIGRRKVDGVTQQCGFIRFKDLSKAKDYMQKYPEVTIEGKVVPFVFAKNIKRDLLGDAPSKKLYVTGFQSEMTEDDLIRLFDNNCKIVVPISAKGYCFAEFEDEDSKQRFIENFNDKVLPDGSMLSVKPAFVRKTFFYNRTREESSGNPMK